MKNLTFLFLHLVQRRACLGLAAVPGPAFWYYSIQIFYYFYFMKKKNLVIIHEVGLRTTLWVTAYSFKNIALWCMLLSCEEYELSILVEMMLNCSSMCSNQFISPLFSYENTTFPISLLTLDIWGLKNSCQYYT